VTAAVKKPTRAAYCPATLSFIRDCVKNRVGTDVIARELVWSPEELQRVARKHGIELVSAAPETSLEPLSHRRALPSNRPTPRLHHHEFNASMSLDDIMDGLPPRQADLFRILVRAAGQLIPGRIIAEQMGCERDTICSYINGVRAKLRNTNWRIESVAQANGGYRLVTQSGRAD